MERLARHDEVHAAALERRGLRRAGHAREAGMPVQAALARLPHPFVGLDAEDAIAVLQEQLTQDARPRPHVRDDGGAREVALRLEET